MKILLLLIGVLGFVCLHGQKELSVDSDKADSLAYYESQGDYKTIFEKGLVNLSARGNLTVISASDSLALIDSIFQDSDFLAYAESRMAHQRMILNGDWELGKDDIEKVLRSFSVHHKNPNYLDHPIVQKDRILIEYFSHEIEQKRAIQVVKARYPYYDSMSVDTKSMIFKLFTEEKGIDISSSEALELMKYRSK